MPVPVTRLLFAAIVSKILLSVVFLIIISPSPALTFSSNVKKILAVFETFISLSAGVLDAVSYTHLTLPTTPYV